MRAMLVKGGISSVTSTYSHKPNLAKLLSNFQKKEMKTGLKELTNPAKTSRQNHLNNFASCIWDFKESTDTLKSPSIDPT